MQTTVNASMKAVRVHTKIAELFDRGAVRPIVETILPLSEAKRAHDLSEAGHVRGEIVLAVA